MCPCILHDIFLVPFDGKWFLLCFAFGGSSELELTISVSILQSFEASIIKPITLLLGFSPAIVPYFWCFYVVP